MSEAELAKCYAGFHLNRNYIPRREGYAHSGENILQAITTPTGYTNIGNITKVSDTDGSVNWYWLGPTSSGYSSNFILQFGKNQEIPNNSKSDKGIPWNYQNLFVYRRTS